MPVTVSKRLKLPKTRRQYHEVFGLDGGLDYSKPSTMIQDIFTPRCDEVLFRNRMVSKAKGSQYFASTNTTPLTGDVMHIRQYTKLSSGSPKLMAHTKSNSYVYNTSSKLFECITRGVVVEDCEDVWSVNSPTTCAVDTDSRKGTYSVAITIPSTEGVGVAAYETLSSVDLSSYTYLHYYIKSSVATEAADLDIRISDDSVGGTGGNYVDYSIPALAANTWTEVSIALSGTRDDVDSVSLVVAVDKGALVINVDDVMATIQMTGDEDNPITSTVISNFYLMNNGIAPIKYWDQDTATMTLLPGTTTLGTRALGKYGERVVLFGVVDTGTIADQRVQWTVVGGISSTPATTDWTATGSGNTDIQSTMKDDKIVNAAPLGSYYIIYGEHTVVLMDYTGKVSSPFAFYTRVPGKGMRAPRAMINLGNEHIFLGWDNIYSYKGGKDVEPIGKQIRDELLSIINPEYASRSFMSYDEQFNQVKLHIPLAGDSTPTKHFLYDLRHRNWSRGTRSYTAAGGYRETVADTWDTIGDSATATWNEQTIRWDDVQTSGLVSMLYGDTAGKVVREDESTNNLVGSAIDGFFETKDFVTGERYRATITNWMELNFEAKGNSLTIEYSTDFGEGWSVAETFTLSGVWTRYRFDFNANSPQVRFRVRNNILGETFDFRWLEIGYVEGSDRGL